MKQTLKRAWTVTLGNPQLKIGLVLLCILLLVALLAPVIAPYDPYFMSDELVEAPSGMIICIPRTITAIRIPGRRRRSFSGTPRQRVVGPTENSMASAAPSAMR